MAKKQNPIAKRVFVPLLACVIGGTLGLAACSGTQSAVPADTTADEALPPIPADLTGGKPWIDSCVAGNVTADTPTSPTDDLYLYANKDWIVTSKIPEGSPTLDFDVSASGRERVQAALAGPALADHDAHQAQLLFGAFVNTTARDAAACEPAKRVIDDIRSLKSIDDINAFLLDLERSAGVPAFVRVNNKTSVGEHRWVTRVEPASATFGSTEATMDINVANVDPASKNYQARLALVQNVLTRAGYTESEAKQAFEGRLALEKEIIRLAEKAQNEQGGTSRLTLDKLDGIAGAFPLRRLVEIWGYGQAAEFEIHAAAELRALGELYTNERLDDLRNYLICGYALEVGSWLDTAAFDAWVADFDVNVGHISISMPERNTTIEQTATNLATVVVPTLVGRTYVMAYDLAPVKEFVTTLAHDAIESHKQIVSASTWLSDSTKRVLTEKLDAVALNLVYPDVREDYSRLDLEGLSYYEARRAIWLNDIARNAALTGTEVDNRLWDAPTLIEGAGSYDPFNNSFRVDAGEVEEEVTRYKAGEITLAELLGGRTGYIVFHELGHALDSGNIYVDKNGNDVEASLLTPDELKEYERRAAKIETYFDGISIWEGQQLTGSICEKEALAEICGMQARLAYAAKQNGFDYQTFFIQRAKLAPCLHTPEYELAFVLGWDRHPSAYLDTNVTVQQFDEFVNAFGVKEGDAMYLSPENRLVIW